MANAQIGFNNRQSEVSLTEALIRECFDFGPEHIMDVYVGRNDYGQPGADVDVKDKCGNRVLRIFDPHGDDYGMTADFQAGYMLGKEVRIEHEGFRRKGLGKRYVQGRVKLAQKLGLSKIRITAGREDGAYFWSRHGWRLLDATQAKKFKDAISRNLEYADEAVFSQKQIKTIKMLLAKDNLDINQELVRLRFSGEQISKLFAGVEARMVLDLSCKKSVSILKAALKRGNKDLSKSLAL